MNTTLKKIKQHTPCDEGWSKLLKFLNKTEPDNEPLQIRTILESNGLEDAIWALRAVEGHEKAIRLMACDFAESVVNLANDERSVTAISVSRRYANGEATFEELTAARDAAMGVSWDAAWDSARDAAWAAASDSASDAAWAAALAAARAADRDADSAALSAEKQKQKEIMLKYI